MEPGKKTKCALWAGIAVGVLASTRLLMAQGPMHGSGEMQAIHGLFDGHDKITRIVNKLDNGVETVTESTDPKVRGLIREHVAAMYQRLANKQPIRMWDPLYAEIFRQADKIKMTMTNTPNGLKVVETSSDPWVVKLLHSHADGVSEFAKVGMPAMHKEHPLPERTEAEARVLPLRTTIGAGGDRQVEPLFTGPGRKLTQITLRNGAVLAAHKSAVPITIQCVTGSGTLQVGAAGRTYPLAPGALVTIEANVTHEITAGPAVSILLTQFVAP